MLVMEKNRTERGEYRMRNKNKNQVDLEEHQTIHNHKVRFDMHIAQRKEHSVRTQTRMQLDAIKFRLKQLAELIK